MAGGARDRGDAAHEGAADAQYVNVHAAADSLNVSAEA